MSFKEYISQIDIIEEEIDYNSFIIDESDEDCIHPDEIDYLLEDEDLTEAAKKFKSTIEILKDRWKAKSRLQILQKMAGAKDPSEVKIQPVTMAMFQQKFEWNPKAGKLGKWIMRKNKGAFTSSHPIGKIIKDLKKKRKNLKKIKKKGSSKAKSRISSKRKLSRLGGKTVDSKGKIVSK